MMEDPVNEQISDVGIVSRGIISAIQAGEKVMSEDGNGGRNEPPDHKRCIPFPGFPCNSKGEHYMCPTCVLIIALIIAVTGFAYLKKKGKI